MWWVVATVVASLVISFVFRPKPPSAPAPGLSEISAPTAEVNRSIPVLFGTRDLNGPNVVWWGAVRLTAIKKKAGKK